RKDFRWRHPDGTLSRNGEISGTNRLYGLELVKAEGEFADDQRKYGLLVEGEKSADAVRVATDGGGLLVAGTVCGARHHADRELVITSAVDVEEDVVDFLVPHRVPRGELTLVAGMPGDGKTLWWIEIVACITRGDFGDPPADVLITSTEDSIRTTIRPRLRVA